MKKIITPVLIITILVSFSLTICYIVFLGYGKKSTAGEKTKVIDSQAQWQAGIYDENIDLTSTPGSVKVNLANFDYSEVDLSSAVTSASINELCSDTPIGGAEVPDCWISLYGGGAISVSTWGFDYDPAAPLNQWWKVDFGSVVENIAKITLVSNGTAGILWDVYYSENDIDYSSAGSMGGAGTVDLLQSPNFDAKYIKVVGHSYSTADEVAGLASISFYTGYAVSHTTAPTQIDGQEGDESKTLIEWTSFEATDNTPENTSITYEFRVSDDAENWTEWTSNFASLENRRYLQVKATLASNDGVSTPQIDDYTINFHNNLPPNAPTAETVIIGE